MKVRAPAPGSPPTVLSILVFLKSVRAILTDTVDPYTGGLRVHERYIIEAPPRAGPSGGKQSAAAAADSSAVYLDPATPGVRSFSCTVTFPGLENLWKWCVPHLVVDAAEASGFKMRFVADSGAVAMAQLVQDEVGGGGGGGGGDGPPASKKAKKTAPEPAQLVQRVTRSREAARDILNFATAAASSAAAEEKGGPTPGAAGWGGSKGKAGKGGGGGK